MLAMHDDTGNTAASFCNDWLQDEEGVTIRKVEVWHSEENAKLMREYDKGYCGGVPFFYNTKTGKWICGSASYEKLRDWAVDK